MKKDYLIQVLQNHPKFLKSLSEGDTIEFEMPPFCSGDYEAKVYKDQHGLYIDRENNFFTGCREFSKKKVRSRALTKNGVYKKIPRSTVVMRSNCPNWDDFKHCFKVYKGQKCTCN